MAKRTRKVMVSTSRTATRMSEYSPSEELQPSKTPGQGTLASLNRAVRQRQGEEGRNDPSLFSSQ